MPVLACLALIALAQGRAATLGKTDVQILAMGRKGWNDFYLGRQGDSTAAMSSAEALYADALAARNDRLLKGAKRPLRAQLIAFEEDAIAVGSAISGGGTMWNITAGSFYADAEETLYAVLTHTRRGPKIRVSDAQASIENVRGKLHHVAVAEDAAEGRAAMRKLDSRFRSLVATARGLDRSGSDAILNFCRSTARSVAQMTGPQ